MNLGYVKRSSAPALLSTRATKAPLFMSQSISTGYISPGNRRGLAQNCPRSRDLSFESWEFDKGGDFVEIQSETFCPCICFISDKYRVPQKLLKMRNITLFISSSNYAKHHIRVCSGGDLCSPFLAIFLKHPVYCEGWF